MIKQEIFVGNQYAEESLKKWHFGYTMTLQELGFGPARKLPRFNLETAIGSGK